MSSFGLCHRVTLFKVVVSFCSINTALWFYWYLLLQISFTLCLGCYSLSLWSQSVALGWCAHQVRCHPDSAAYDDHANRWPCISFYIHCFISSWPPEHHRLVLRRLFVVFPGSCLCRWGCQSIIMIIIIHCHWIWWSWCMDMWRWWWLLGVFPLMLIWVLMLKCR